MTVVAIQSGVTADVVARIPENVQGVYLNRGMNSELTKALPLHVKEVFVLPWASIEAIVTLPKYIRTITLREKGQPEDVLDAVNCKKAFIQQGVNEASSGALGLQ